MTQIVQEYYEYISVGSIIRKCYSSGLVIIGTGMSRVHVVFFSAVCTFRSVSTSPHQDLNSLCSSSLESFPSLDLPFSLAWLGLGSLLAPSCLPPAGETCTWILLLYRHNSYV